jgi:hypothetical protein
VKPLSGSRGELAGGAHGDDERDAAGDAAAAGASDPELRAMRAVWLAMRDEEPPAGGLSALLVAAREKAETMQPRPAWWQRLAAGLRRPPALAFATVVVLAGGALYVTRNAGQAPVGSVAEPARDERTRTLSSDRPSAPPAASRDAKEKAAKGNGPTEDGLLRAAAPGPGPSVAAAAERARGGGSVSGDEPPGSKKTEPRFGAGDAHGAAAAPPEVASPEVASPPSPALSTSASPPSPVLSTRASPPSPAMPTRASPPSPAMPTRASPPSPSPRPDANRALAGDTPKLSRGAAADPRTNPRPSGAPAARPTAPTAADAGKDVDDARTGSRREPSTIATDEATGVEPAAGAAATSAGSPRAAQQAPSESLDQLYKDCATAARRGDCVAVRKMVGKITKTDRGYRARAAKDAAVAKCLTE